jgi:hypothetical protein
LSTAIFRSFGPKMIVRTLQVFTTDELTALLGLDPKKDKRRVIKFVESREYGIVPSIKLASGSGSRRLYDLENVCEFAVALHLLKTGLRSQIIGEVIRQLRKKGKLSRKLEDTTKLQDLRLVIARAAEPGRSLNPKLSRAVSILEGGAILTEYITKEFCDSNNGADLILIPIGRTFSGLRDHLFQLRSDWATENL